MKSPNWVLPILARRRRKILKTLHISGCSVQAIWQRLLPLAAHFRGARGQNIPWPTHSNFWGGHGPPGPRPPSSATPVLPSSLEPLNFKGVKVTLPSVAKRYFVPPPLLIAICRPYSYLEPARFARQNLSVEIPLNLPQIFVNRKFVNFYQKR